MELGRISMRWGAQTFTLIKLQRKRTAVRSWSSSRTHLYMMQNYQTKAGSAPTQPHFLSFLRPQSYRAAKVRKTSMQRISLVQLIRSMVNYNMLWITLRPILMLRPISRRRNYSLPQKIYLWLIQTRMNRQQRYNPISFRTHKTFLRAISCGPHKKSMWIQQSLVCLRKATQFVQAILINHTRMCRCGLVLPTTRILVAGTAYT